MKSSEALPPPRKMTIGPKIVNFAKSFSWIGRFAYYGLFVYVLLRWNKWDKHRDYSEMEPILIRHCSVCWAMSTDYVPRTLSILCVWETAHITHFGKNVWCVNVVWGKLSALTMDVELQVRAIFTRCHILRIRYSSMHKMNRTMLIR